MPVAYIPRTRELYNAYTPYRWVVNEEPPPWTPLKKPLAQCKANSTLHVVSPTAWLLSLGYYVPCAAHRKA